MATQRKLTAGPSKFELMLSLFEGKRVTFTIEGVGAQETLVTSVGAEDDSHENWNIQGSLTQMELRKFKGYFDTRTRQGFIEADFEESKPTDERIPKVGDRAYTKYHGQTLEGVITSVNEQGYGVIEPVDPNTDWGWHKGALCFVGNERRAVRGLFFGYDERAVWDTDKGMWYTPADDD